MGFWSVRKNGLMTIPSLAISGPSLPFLSIGGPSFLPDAGAIRLRNNQGISWRNSTNTANLTIFVNDTNHLQVNPTIYFANSTVVSTFAQAATLLNGPRAANPVTWVKVGYSTGSTGRMPVW